MEFVAKSFNELSTLELYEILKARAKVFVNEQKIIYVDADNIDKKALHLFLWDNGEVLAYMRAFLEDDNNAVKIGRVLTVRHGKGIGRQLLEKSIPEIKKHFSCNKIYMDSQKSVVGFYEKFGFKVTSDEFLEEGIVHLKMEREV